MFKSNEIGKRIKNLRKKINFNQGEFVKGLNIKRSALSQIENGNLQPSLELIQRIVSKYKIPYNWLLEGNPSDYLEEYSYYEQPKKKNYPEVPSNIELVNESNNNLGDSTNCENCKKYLELIYAQKETIRTLKELVRYLKGQLENSRKNNA